MSGTTMSRPMPPPHLLQRIANSPSVEAFTQSFPRVREQVRSYLDQAGYDFAACHKILDLGCGVGRFMFAFEKELGPDQRIWGCDVHEECARWCRENIDFAEVSHCGIHPPLPYDDGQFDLVYALSVYTHLRLDMQFRWAWEVYRVLRPGGILFATFHGPQFFSVFHEFRQITTQHDIHSFGHDGLFGYLEFPSDEGADNGQGQVHVASSHDLNFFREQFSAFELVKRFPQSLLAGGQDLYIIRKPAHGKAIERPMATPEAWSWQERIEPSGTVTPVQLTFKLEGQRRFHIYPSVRPNGFYRPEFRVEIRDGDGIIVDRMIRHSTNRMSGESHNEILEVSVPEHHGEVEVRLSTTITDRGSLSPEDALEVTWCFPNFTS
jgi:SAM-dependent methyltransferase